ncbi:IclR family transcriptional regulator [Sulfitobacter sp. PR48]|uniref:IclR family transcriptional regulator n=1 Tax=Sulfitobacter sp. PR48 TaxID=3028383 RepID=UPI00237B0EEF|nr:IclR family transcriptional regulator [Sulfitobacter sp. PR48]MDD9721091.1 IclR family transcriptional regulator [Sulfitobacter sp. PR48]
MRMVEALDNAQRDGEKQDPRFLTSVARGFRVLEALSAHYGAMSLTELSRKTDLTVPTLQRLTATLVEAGYVEKEPSSKRYGLTVKTVDLLFSYLSRNQFAERAWPHLVHLRETLGVSISMSIPLQDSMIYVHRLAAYAGDFENTLPGKKIPLCLSAAGRCVLSQQPRQVVERYLAQVTIPALTPFSLTDPEKILAEIDLCRVRGYALVKRETSPGLMTIACPAMRGKTAIAGISAHVPLAGNDEEAFVAKVLQPVVSVSHALSAG